MMETRNKGVLVLMSTYNGERFIRQQIDSILGQEGVPVRMLVRDDGSSDGTLRILAEYKSQGLIDYYCGSNIGPQRSFMHLLQNAPTSEYYAFSDQDDVWLPDKLKAAVGSLADYCDMPSLYFCQTQLTDDKLKAKDSVIIHPKLTFGESLVYKFIGGCTMVMNHRLREVIGDKMPAYMRMHDIWVYSIAQAANAHIHFDPKPHILYRQHGDNTLGQGQGFFYEWKQRLKRFARLKNDRFRQAYELMACYGDRIPADNKRLLAKFISGKKSFSARMGLMFDNRLRCADPTTQVLFWINLLFNKY